jgi:hypothetical protein
MSYEVIELDGIRYAEIIWAGTEVATTSFFSAPESSFQFGLLAHQSGYREPPHTHRKTERAISDLQQMFVVQRGKVAVQFYAADGALFREVVLGPGDAINLMHGAHAIQVLEDMQCISVKQGPFHGDNMDKMGFRTKP